MENRGATLRERTQAARTFMRVLPLPVPAMLKQGTACGVRLPRFGQRISRRILPCETAFRIRRAQNGLQRAGL